MRTGSAVPSDAWWRRRASTSPPGCPCRERRTSIRTRPTPDLRAAFERGRGVDPRRGRRATAGAFEEALAARGIHAVLSGVRWPACTPRIAPPPHAAQPLRLIDAGPSSAATTDVEPDDPGELMLTCARTAAPAWTSASASSSAAAGTSCRARTTTDRARRTRRGMTPGRPGSIRYRYFGRFQRDARLILVTSLVSGAALSLYWIDFNLYLASLGPLDGDDRDRGDDRVGGRGPRRVPGQRGIGPGRPPGGVRGRPRSWAWSRSSGCIAERGTAGDRGRGGAVGGGQPGDAGRALALSHRAQRPVASQRAVRDPVRDPERDQHHRGDPGRRGRGADRPLAGPRPGGLGHLPDHPRADGVAHGGGAGRRLAAVRRSAAQGGRTSGPPAGRARGVPGRPAPSPDVARDPHPRPDAVREAA